MKIKYQKPQILFEGFELETSIAATCQYVQSPTKTYDTDCMAYPIDDKELKIFSASNSNCKFSPVDGLYDDLCYQVPNDAMNVFHS